MAEIAGLTWTTANHYQRLSIRHRLRDEWLVHQSTPGASRGSG